MLGASTGHTAADTIFYVAEVNLGPSSRGVSHAEANLLKTLSSFFHVMTVYVSSTQSSFRTDGIEAI